MMYVRTFLYCLKVTRRFPVVKQEMLAFKNNPISQPVGCNDHVTESFDFYVMFCRSQEIQFSKDKEHKNKR